MDLWETWLDAIRGIVALLATDAGLGLGLGVVAATLLLRTALLPLSWPIACRACVRQKKLRKLQPELRALQERFRRQPDLYLRKLRELYEANDLSMVDARSFLAAIAQFPFFLGMFQVLRSAGDGVRFLWIPNLLRPDAALAIVAGLTTALMMLVNPDLPEQVRVIMILLPGVLAVLFALQFSSALTLYWATSSTFSALHTVAMHAIVRRRIRAGLVRI
jgi:YidC/Oxa1 family membrane protein insertase